MIKHKGVTIYDHSKETNSFIGRDYKPAKFVFVLTNSIFNYTFTEDTVEEAQKKIDELLQDGLKPI
jgi:hypothetical protein